MVEHKVVRNELCHASHQNQVDLENYLDTMTESLRFSFIQNVLQPNDKWEMRTSNREYAKCAKCMATEEPERPIKGIGEVSVRISVAQCKLNITSSATCIILIRVNCTKHKNFE